MSPRSRALAGAVSSALCLVLAACGARRQADQLPPEVRSSARIDLFLRSTELAGESVSFELAAVHARSASGELQELALSRRVVESEEARTRLELAGAEVPPGTYDAVVLVLRAATRGLGAQRQSLRLLPPEPTLPDAEPDPLEGLVPEATPETVEYPIPVQVEVGRRQAVSVFLDWSVAPSLVEPFGFRPLMVSSLARPQVRFRLLYVTDPVSGTVRAVDRRTGEVVGSAATGDGAVAIAVPRGGFQLYVANAGSGSVSVVDTRRYLTIDTVPIRLGAEPSDITVTDLGRTLALTNFGIDTVSLIDIPTSSRVADVRVGRQPLRLAAAPSLRRLFVANSGSDDVSVIDVEQRRQIAAIVAESVPTCVALDRRETELYVGHRISGNLLVLDARTYARRATIYTGNSVTAVLADRTRDRIYVARSSPPELLIVDRQILDAVRRVRLSAPIENLVQPVDGVLVYGAAPTLQALLPIDVVVGREEAPIPCGAPITDVGLDH